MLTGVLQNQSRAVNVPSPPEPIHNIWGASQSWFQNRTYAQVKADELRSRYRRTSISGTALGGRKLEFPVCSDSCHRQSGKMKRDYPVP
jgi:hypothetical protein